MENCPTCGRPMDGHDEPPKVKRFVPPTVEEVRAYCEKRGNTIDPELFVAHYETRGWKVGEKTPMKSWTAAVITWEKREGKGNARTGNGQRWEGAAERRDRELRERHERITGGDPS